MHALIIEDHGITAWLIEEELRDLGFDSFDVAASEAEALAAASRRRPDLITSDSGLIEGNGIAAVRQIRARGEIPVIFITGDPEAARTFAPDAVIVEKPFSGAALGRAMLAGGAMSWS